MTLIEALRDAISVIEHWIPLFEQHNAPAAIREAIVQIEKQKWHGADERPPYEGYYLVYATTEIIPDHNDLPNAYWETKIGYWDNRYGWMTGKTRYWQELPELPEEVKHDDT